jgi:hypothetical protein
VEEMAHVLDWARGECQPFILDSPQPQLRFGDTRGFRALVEVYDANKRLSGRLASLS